jgi:hypothetical protein
MALGLAVPSLVLSGVAYAFWSASGSGAGTVKATSAVPLTVTSIATPLADLFPGKTDDLGFTVTNTNGYRVSLTTLTAISVTSSDQTACPASNITLSASPGYTLPTPVNVAANSSAGGTLSGLVTMATSAPDGCQGKTFTVNLAFSGAQY